MGEMIDLDTGNGPTSAYLAGGDSGGPGVLVIQEYWGLVPHIKDVADRYAAAGFTALAPDLYHGEQATEPDGAGKLMMALNLTTAAKEMNAAITVVQQRSGRNDVGVVGYCMGGGLALVLACARPDAIKACAPYYGVIPWESAQPDWSAMQAKVVGEYGELDAYFGPGPAKELEDKLRALGKDATIHIHAGADHAFFNDARPEVYDAEASATAFARTVELFKTTLSA
jgi:carboxymethylenebutenolidase